VTSVSRFPAAVRQYAVALRALVLMTVVLGLAYPLLVTGIAQATDSDRANGQLISSEGRVVGSRLLGQSFTDADGNPLPEWFQSRPSAGGYDGKASGAPNLGPSDPALAEAIEKLRQDVAAFDSVPGHEINPADVPVDAVTASASGLDPQISVAYADQQVRRVAAARHLDVDAVQGLVTANTDSRSLGFLGEPGVNVLTLNLAVARLG
jgi:K+-transporting ATPase ATPase C chain